MYLKELRLLNFKNYKEAILHPSTGINCIIGKNGSGKTNLLDAIHYLSFTKSAFNSSDIQNIRHKDSFFSLLAKIKKGKKELPLSCSLKKGTKKIFKFDGHEYEKLSKHIGQFPVVLIAPNDTDLIRNGNEVRRKYFDRHKALIKCAASPSACCQGCRSFSFPPVTVSGNQSHHTLSGSL